MIGTAIATGAAVRPFYNRGAGGGAVPLARTALGTAAEVSVPGNQLILTPVTVPAHALVVVGCVFSEFAGVGLVPVLWGSDAAAFTLDTFLVMGVSGYFVGIYSYTTAGVGRAGDSIVLDFTLGFGDNPEWSSLFACYCLGVLDAAPQDRVQGATGVSGDQDSGLTVFATTQAKEFVVGCIGTNGTSGDTVGAWQAGLSAGQDTGLPGCQIKEGFLLANAIAQQRAQVTGATVAEFTSLVQTYKGT